jgi:hypothetical protein
LPPGGRVNQPVAVALSNAQPTSPDVDINTQFLKHILSDISISSLSETEPESEDERKAFIKKYNVCPSFFSLDNY